MDKEKFRKQFKVLTEFDRFAWQERMYERLMTYEFPKACDIPTGLGKTSILPIWLLALAHHVQSNDTDTPFPRRLVYIVNRRTIVDQATDETETLLKRLKQPSLEPVREALMQMCSIRHEEPFAISTLRGQKADNKEWQADPSRPAIIIGTIDLIGSMLLFSSYRNSYKIKPLHAGLIGQDSLIVHDEAHLSPAFSNLLHKIQYYQKKDKDQRPNRVIELSATQRNENEISINDIIVLEESDEKVDEEVSKRINAKKTLYLHDFKDKSQVIEKIVECAVKHKDSKVRALIYVTSPEDVNQIKIKLEKIVDKDSIIILTGTIRGYERDKLVENPVYRYFRDKSNSTDKTVYLVSTSAGEVGANFNADHLVCDLSTLDSMIQRLGRVNRFGNGDAKIDIIYENPEDEKKNKKKQVNERLEEAKKLTLQALQSLRDNRNGDASPKALRSLTESDEWKNAVSPPPVIPELTDILLDNWSLTSIRADIPGRPPVADWLHGVQAELPDTYVAWRKEVKWFDNEEIDNEAIQEWFDACPIETHETLREQTWRVKNHLKKIIKRIPNQKVIVINERGKVEKKKAEDLLNEYRIEYSTIVLPVEAGGLTKDGMLDGIEKDSANDVAEEYTPRRRLLLNLHENEYWVKELDADNSAVDDIKNNEILPCNSLSDSKQQIAENYKMIATLHIPLQVSHEGNEDERADKYLLLMTEPKQEALGNPESAGRPIQPTVCEHTEDVIHYTEKIAKALLSDNPKIKEALEIAAQWHDWGKTRQIWQQSIYNRNGEPLAKPGRKGMDWQLLGGFRHEFASLLKANNSPEIMNHSERDLILHLIAAHHGRARPHFELNAFDMECTTIENEEAAHEVMRRFGRMQQRFGRWGLAWLESLLRCADIEASQNPSNAKSNTEVRS